MKSEGTHTEGLRMSRIGVDRFEDGRVMWGDWLLLLLGALRDRGIVRFKGGEGGVQGCVWGRFWEAGWTDNV